MTVLRLLNSGKSITLPEVLYSSCHLSFARRILRKALGSSL